MTEIQYDNHESRNSNRYGISIAAGAVAGGIGALLFAAFTLVTNRFVILIGLVPAAAAGFGVSLGIEETDSSLGAALGGFLALGSMAAGYIIIQTQLSFLYTYNWGLLDWATLVVGTLIGVGWGANVDVEEDEKGDDKQTHTHQPRQPDDGAQQQERTTPEAQTRQQERTTPEAQTRQQERTTARNRERTGVRQSAGRANHWQYASFGSRTVAFIIDSLLTYVTFFLYFFYWVYRTAKYGDSIGKRYMGIVVVTRTGSRNLGFRVTLIREVFGRFIDSVLLFVGGVLWILIDDHNQAIHDKIADTYVLKEDAVENDSQQQ